MSGSWVLEPIEETAMDAGAVAVFDVLGTKGTMRAMIMSDGSLVRISPADTMAASRIQRTRRIFFAVSLGVGCGFVGVWVITVG